MNSLIFSVITASGFAVQLLLCKFKERTAVRLIPVYVLTVLLALIVMLLAGVFGTDGEYIPWNVAIGLIGFMIWLGAAVGVLIAWIVYGVAHFMGRM
ncbi:MAG: hypothetical protein Q4E57_04830 [Eubacteriales bacterium]|nr:hypothetical protein [Eubacteriales bacterium]